MSTPYSSEGFLHQLLAKALSASASDVHLRVGQPPGARVRGEMVYFRVDKIRPDDTEAVSRILLGVPAGRDPLDGKQESVTAYQIASGARFRVSIYRQRGTLSVVMRSIAPKVPTLEVLGHSTSITVMAEQTKGLVIVAGGATQGKTTTLAAMVDHLNTGFAKHVITIEDPIEFVHVDETGSISQREVGTDTASILAGLRSAARQDPDIVMVSSIDSPEVLSAALDLADTGRLVLASVPMVDVPRAVTRLLTLTPVPSERERFIEHLQGIVAQRLLVKRDGTGLILATEILAGVAAAREALRRPAEGASALKKLMDTGQSGMQTFESHIQKLITSSLISRSSST